MDVLINTAVNFGVNIMIIAAVLLFIYLPITVSAVGCLVVIVAVIADSAMPSRTVIGWWLLVTLVAGFISTPLAFATGVFS